MMTLAGFRGADPAALETLYQGAPLGPAPTGRFRGRHLGTLDNPGARQLHVRAVDWLLFEQPRFGLDFDSRRWWFMHPRLQAGRFTATLGRSRWRATDTLRLEYGDSRLPGPVRRALYDEVKPLGPDLALGLGGLNAGPGQGDHFFFVLSRD